MMAFSIRSLRAWFRVAAVVGVGAIETAVHSGLQWLYKGVVSAEHK